MVSQLWIRKNCSMFKILILFCIVLTVRLMTSKRKMEKMKKYYDGIVDKKSKHHHHKEAEESENKHEEIKKEISPLEQERLDNGAPVQIAWPMNSQCTKRGDLSFYAYYTLWRNDRMPMYVVSCTSPRTDGAEFVEAAYSYFQKNKYEPTVRYDEAALDGKYVVMMVDADAPTPHAAKCRYWLHWAVSEVEGRHLRNGVNWLNTEGRVLKEYNPPTPAKGSGKHRYQFLLFAQRYPYSDLSTDGERCGFDPKTWAKENKLELVASSIFTTEYE